MERPVAGARLGRPGRRRPRWPPATRWRRPGASWPRSTVGRWKQEIRYRPLGRPAGARRSTTPSATAGDVEVGSSGRFFTSTLTTPAGAGVERLVRGSDVDRAARPRRSASPRPSGRWASWLDGQRARPRSGARRARPRRRRGPRPPGRPPRCSPARPRRHPRWPITKGHTNSSCTDFAEEDLADQQVGSISAPSQPHAATRTRWHVKPSQPARPIRRGGPVALTQSRSSP